MSIRSNLAVRLRLMRLALTKRFVYHDIVAMAEAYGLKIADVRGNVGPLDLWARCATAPEGVLPDFSPLAAAEIIREDNHTVNWSSEPSVARFLGQLAAARRSGVVLEIGSFIGWTTAHIACGLRHAGADGRVHYLEFDRAYLERATATLRSLGLASWTVPHHGDSLDPAVQARLPRAADIIFIDTTHAYEQTRAEIAHYRTRLGVGGCLVLHDSVSLPGVRRAVFEVRDEFEMCTFATERSNGVTVMFPRPR